MISFEHRVLSEYKIKTAKIDILANYIMVHRDPKGIESKDASNFLDVLITETDEFYKKFNEILSNNGKRPHTRSRLTGTKQWNKNAEQYYEKNPRKIPKKQ